MKSKKMANVKTAGKVKLTVCLLLCLLFCGCAGQPAEKPDPGTLYTAIAEAAALTDMLELTSDELLALTGIEPEQYTACAAYQTISGTRPDEVILLRALDETAANDIASKLNARLAYKRKSVENYFTEYQPILDSAVVRRDGLTLALLAVERIDEAIAAYEK